MKNKFLRMVSFISIKTPIAAVLLVAFSSVLLWIVLGMTKIPHYKKYHGKITVYKNKYYIEVDLSEAEKKYYNPNNILWYYDVQGIRYRGKIEKFDNNTLQIENIDNSVNLNSLAGSDVFVEIHIGQERVIEKFFKRK